MSQGAEVRADFEVLGLDLRGFYFAAVHLRLDDRGLRLRLIGNDGRRRHFAAMGTSRSRDSSAAARRTLLSRISILQFLAHIQAVEHHVVGANRRAT